MSDRFGHIPIESPESSPPEKEPTQKASRAPGVTLSKGKQRSPIKAWAWIAGVVIIFAGYALVGFLGVPYYVTRVVPSHFHEKTGMTLEPTAVTFNPFTLRFQAGNLQILNAAGTAIMSLRSLVADVAPASLFQLSVVCNTVTISGIDLNLAREVDGSYNFQHIFGAGKNNDQSAMISVAELPFSFSLNNISITDSRITFNDARVGKSHTAEKIQLDLPSFANIPFQTDQYLRPHFSAVVNGSPVELSGQTHLGEADGQDQATRLSVNLHDLDLTIYSGYLPFSLPMDFKKGTADGKVDLVFDPQKKSGDRLSIGFQLRISEAKLVREKDSIIITVPTARLNGTLHPVARRLHLTEMAVKEPTVASFGKVWSGNSKSPGAPPEQTTTSGTSDDAPYGLTIDLLLVDNGIVRIFPDKKDAHPASTWNGLQLSVKNYHSVPGTLSGQKGGAFSLSGEKDGSSASFSWQGKFSSTESATGSLKLLKMDSNSLFRAISSDPPFEFRGLADLAGQLKLSSTKDSAAPLAYELVDAEVSIEDFILIEQEQSILTGEVVTLTPFSVVDTAVNFGNVRFREGGAHFTYGRIPGLFTAVNDHKYRLQGIDFAGTIRVGQQEKSAQDLIFTEVALKVNQLDCAPATADNLSISGKTETGGIFKAQGQVSLTPFSLAVKTGFRDLPAKNIWPFFMASPLLRDIAGKLSGQGQFELPVKSFAGELQLTDGAGKGPKQTAVSWQKSVLQDVNYRARPFHLGIASVAIDHGRFPWEITQEDNGPMQYLADFINIYLPPVATESAAEPRFADAPVEIEEISFANSRIKIHDRRLTPDWQGEIVNFSGKINNIHRAAAKDQSTFSFTGQLDGTPFTFNGAMDLFSQEQNGTFHFSLDNYPLASFYQQLAGKTDAAASNGEFRLSLDGTWQDQLYVNSGNLTLIDLRPAAPTSDLALPLALLTEPDGTLQLPFDFTRTEPTAKATLFDELLTSFQTKIIKGSVSPLLLAGEDFSALIGSEFIEFQPGEFMISATGQTVLGRYAALLATHPRVGLVLSGGINKEADSLAMKEQLTAIEQQRVALENEKLLQKWQEQKALYQKTLAEQQKMAGPGSKIVEQDIPSDILAGFTPLPPLPIVIDEAMLLELAEKRINLVNQFFATELDLPPGRISIATPDSFDEVPESPTTGVNITLKAINR